MTKKETSMRRVTIIKTLVKQYRRPFFEQLHSSLIGDGVELEVLYGKPSQQELAKADNINLAPPLGQRIPSYYMWQGRVLLQWPGWRRIKHSDLIIVVNANRNLLNLPLLAMARLGLKRVALWGHGQNHQCAHRTLRERFKEHIATWPHWWFAYTECTAEYLASIGYDRSHISTINNAVDTTSFAARVSAVTVGELDEMRTKLHLSSDDRVVLYCGSLYPEKRLPIMLEAARIAAKRDPKFRLLIIGCGSLEDFVRDATRTDSYLRYAGPLFGQDKAICYRMAEFILNPGLVGLAILDAFAAGRPLLTLTDSLHSPEIAYLDHDKNGLLIEGDACSLADAMIRLLDDPSKLDLLCEGARKTSTLYSVEEMVRRVREGILQCLNYPIGSH